MPDFESDAQRHLVPFDGNFSLGDFPNSIDEPPPKKALKKELEALVEELHEPNRLQRPKTTSAVISAALLKAMGISVTTRSEFRTRIPKSSTAYVRR